MEDQNDFICTVVSLVPWEINEFKPGLIPGHFHIARSDSYEPQITYVGESRHNVYLDSSRGSLPVIDPSYQVAESLVKDFIDGQLVVGADQQPALFWIQGKLTIDEIKKNHSTRLKLASMRQKKWFVAICRLADDDWKRYQKHNVVSDNQRTAANIMNYKASDHPWMSMDEVSEQELCIHCRVRIDRESNICYNCKLPQNDIGKRALMEMNSYTNQQPKQHSVIG